MTEEEFGPIAMLLHVAYKTQPDAVRFDKQALTVWYTMLQDLDAGILKKAVVNIIARSPYQPRISDVRAEYAALTHPPKLSDQEAWAVVRDAIRGSVDFKDLPPDVQAAVVDPAQLWEWGQLESKQVDTVIQALFKKSYAAVLERQRDAAILGQIGTAAGAYAGIEQKARKALEVKDADSN